ncbi:transmembrane protein, putative [Medicago truncatula]|uniref:Transmembrane protein, putative n=1 Tax=Medicago truncatula TaxID=3880 RepID=G8A2U1_MEDTR|nr:transmembrane protein, putative [Medicago truncatula]
MRRVAILAVLIGVECIHLLSLLFPHSTHIKHIIGATSDSWIRWWAIANARCNLACEQSKEVE